MQLVEIVKEEYFVKFLMLKYAAFAISNWFTHFFNCNLMFKRTNEALFIVYKFS